MTTFAKVKRVITLKRNKGILNEDAKEVIRGQMDTFLLAGRIDDDEYNLLTKMLEGED